MDNKPFRPQIVDPTAEHIHQQYGIGDARVQQLADKIALIWAEMELLDEIVMIRGFDRIADFTNTPAEFTFCVMTLTLTLHKHLLQ